MQEINLMRYYVYAYVDLNQTGRWEYDTSLGTVEFDHLPVYIGKGSGGRMEGHLEESCNADLNSLIKEGRTKCFKIDLLDNMTSHLAYKLESELIYLIGRKDLAKGPLFNNSAGINLVEASTSTHITPLNLELNKILHVIEILNKTKSIEEAASILGISERSIYRIKKDYSLERVDGDWIQV